MEQPTDRQHKLERLTEREREVVDLRGQALTINEIALALHITPRTVQFHLGNIYEKLDFNDLTTAYERLDELKQYRDLLNDYHHKVIDVNDEDATSEQVDDVHTPGHAFMLLVLEDEVDLVERPSGKIQPSVIHVSSEAEGRSPWLFRRIWAYSALIALIIVPFVLGSLFGAGVFSWLTSTGEQTTAMQRDESEVDDSLIVKALQPSPSTAATFAITESVAMTQNTPTFPDGACAEAPGTTLPVVDRFKRDQGVSVFTAENTDGAVSNNRVRAITVNEQGVWSGYFPVDPGTKGGIGFFDKQLWGDCNLPQALEQAEVNALITDIAGRIWIGTEGQGIAMLDEGQWHIFGEGDGLPSTDIFGLTTDTQGNVWAATWEGIAKYDGDSWSVPYSIHNNTLHSNHTHTIAFDSTNNIWVGHMRSAGISLYRNDDGQWHHLTSTNSQLAGDEVFSIVVREGYEGMPESVWIGTADGGISRVEGETWTTYRTVDGLPSNQISALQIDKHGRVWVATSQGTAYFEDNEWITYNTLPTLSLAFAPVCTDCPFEEGEHVWTGTDGFGLSHSRLPYLDNDEVVEVQDVCFLTEEGRQRLCPPLERNADTMALQAKLPVELHPGQSFRVEVFVAPRAPYRFQAGDFLANTDSEDALLFGAWRHMAVDRTVEPGEPYTFSHYDTPFVAPDLVYGQSEQEFTSTWRMWMRTRYVGPSIEISFDVTQAPPQEE